MFENDDNDKEFYENVAEAANFVNDRLQDSIAPGGLNSTVEESAEETEETDSITQRVIDGQESNYLPL